MKGSFSVDLKNALTEIYRIRKRKFEDCKMVLLFKSSRLSVALTPLSIFVLFETGNTLFDGINQQLDIWLLKYIR